MSKLLLIGLVFTGCGEGDERIIQPAQEGKPATPVFIDDGSNPGDNNNDQLNINLEEKRDSEELEFDNPGDDEVAQEVNKMDQAINDLKPSGYKETDLSETTLESGIYLE